MPTYFVCGHKILYWYFFVCLFVCDVCSTISGSALCTCLPECTSVASLWASIRCRPPKRQNTYRKSALYFFTSTATLNRVCLFVCLWKKIVTDEEDFGDNLYIILEGLLEYAVQVTADFFAAFIIRPRSPRAYFTDDIRTINVNRTGGAP